MLVSARRAVVATCAVVIFATLATYEAIRTNYVTNPFGTAGGEGGGGRRLSNSSNPEDLGGVNAFWTTEQENPRFAYVQYATDMDYLCNAVININRLKQFAVQNDVVLIYPKAWDNKKSETRESKAMRNLKAGHPDVVFRPFDVLSTHKGDATWRNSLTKFHAFALTDYTRVLAFDSDALVLNNMDFLFLAPNAPVALPRAYWLTENERTRSTTARQMLGSHLMLLEPSLRRHRRIVDAAARSGEFDMEVVNALFQDSAMVLPHRRLALLTGEFRAQDHRRYLAPDEEDADADGAGAWNAMAETSRAYLVHFSDWPLPKPWKPHSDAQWQAALPACPDDDVATADRPRCADRMMWTDFYETYAANKEEYCKILG